MQWHAIFHAWRGQPTDYPRPLAAFPHYSGCSTNVSWHGKGGYDTGIAGVYCTSLGGHAFSTDGSHWYISPVPVYTPVVRFGDNSSLFFRARERPHVILDEEGHPAALATSVGNPDALHPGSGTSGGNCGKTGADHTFTLIQPIANRKHHHVPVKPHNGG